MEAISALDVAGSILAVVEFIAEVQSILPQAQRESALDEDAKFLKSVLKRINKLTSYLFTVHGDTVRAASAGASEPSDDAKALQELALSCIAYLGQLVEDVKNRSRDLSEIRKPELSINNNSGLNLVIKVRFSEERLDGLSRSVKFHVRSIISSRITELRKTVESLKDVRQYARPEQESRIDSMTRDLDELMPNIQREAVDPVVKSFQGFTETDVQLLKTQLTSLTEAEGGIIADKIVTSLNYDSRPVRHGSVPQAHKSTFKWAFDSRLSHWLRSGSGIFWVSGKPGSGKSTFMKFIASQSQTKELLASWAGSADTLAVAAHFFWIAGTAIQRSWQGLLQSLLFDILHRHPSVLPLVTPNRWAAAKAGQWQIAAEPWSVSELAAALRALASAKDTDMPLKICFFIDGLDEFDSDHAELCRVLCDMASSPHIKMCLSSRPWAVFERSFGSDSEKRLDIHELTRNDIQGFVSDQMETHPNWAAQPSTETGTQKTELVEHISAQADGVFLWAFFVTKALREDLSNGKSIAELHKRLRNLPRDLEKLFNHMLESVDSVDHPKMAGILQAAAHAFEPLHIDLYWHVEKELEDLSYAHRCPIGAATSETISRQREQTSRSINDKTKGLLKIVNQRVEFLHRTVKDFVLTKDMGEYLRSKLPAEYNGFASIATAYLGFLKTTRHDHLIAAGIVRLGPGRNSGPFISHLNLALTYASEALKSDQPVSASPHQTTELLDEFEAAIDEMVRVGHVTVRSFNSQDCNPKLPFREELLRHNLTLYIARKLREDPSFFDMFDESPLFAALTPMSISSGESPAPVAGILDLILRRGADPNITPRTPDGSGSASPWVLFSRGVLSVFNMLSNTSMFPALRFNDSLSHGLFDLLLSHGANPNQPLLNRRGARTVFSHFLDISLSKFLGAECFDDYLRTLDAFLRYGASLGIPTATADFDGEAAHGNLARLRPEESILTAYCAELGTLLPRLAADPERAIFVSAVIEKLIFKCVGKEQDLEQLSTAISKGCPENIATPLLRLVESELDSSKTRKRHRGSWGNDSSASDIKHFKAEQSNAGYQRG